MAALLRAAHDRPARRSRRFASSRTAPPATGSPPARASRSDKRLDLLYGVSRTTRASLEAAGIARLEDLVAGRRTSCRRSKASARGPRLASRANAQAWLENRPCGWTRCRRCAASRAGCSTWKRGRIGGRTVPGAWAGATAMARRTSRWSRRYTASRAAGAPDDQQVTLAPDSDAAWEVFAAAVSGDNCPIFHWSGYDARFCAGRLPST